jgi:hypothetical protein
MFQTLETPYKLIIGPETHMIQTENTVRASREILHPLAGGVVDFDYDSISSDGDCPDESVHFGDIANRNQIASSFAVTSSVDRNRPNSCIRERRQQPRRRRHLPPRTQSADDALGRASNLEDDEPLVHATLPQLRAWSEATYEFIEDEQMTDSEWVAIPKTVGLGIGLPDKMKDD